MQNRAASTRQKRQAATKQKRQAATKQKRQAATQQKRQAATKQKRQAATKLQSNSGTPLYIESGQPLQSKSGKPLQCQSGKPLQNKSGKPLQSNSGKPLGNTTASHRYTMRLLSVGKNGLQANQAGIACHRHRNQHVCTIIWLCAQRATHLSYKSQHTCAIHHTRPPNTHPQLMATHSHKHSNNQQHTLRGTAEGRPGL